MGKIVFIGHSVVKGTDYGGVTLEETFSVKIGRNNGYTTADIFNAGVSSDTSSGMLARFQADVIGRSPDVCVFAGCAANDWGFGVPVETFKNNLRSMIEMAKSSSIKCVVFTDVLHRGDAAVFNSYYRFIEATKEVAALKKCPIVDVYGRFSQTVMLGEHASLYVDHIHLTKAGHQYVADHASQPFYTGLFVNEYEPEPAPEASSLLLAVANYVISTGNPGLTAGVAAAMPQA